MIILYYITLIIVALLCVTMFCLFSPNIVYLIHKHHFDWKKPEVIETPNIDYVFNVDTFNEWFNDPNNRAVYAHSGIFLRLDKLSESHITDYLIKKHGIHDTELYYDLIIDFYEQIKKDWLHKLNTK